MVANYEFIANTENINKQTLGKWSGWFIIPKFGLQISLDYGRLRESEERHVRYVLIHKKPKIQLPALSIFQITERRKSKIFNGAVLYVFKRNRTYASVVLHLTLKIHHKSHKSLLPCIIKFNKQMLNKQSKNLRFLAHALCNVFKVGNSSHVSYVLKYFCKSGPLR